MQKQMHRPFTWFRMTALSWLLVAFVLANGRLGAAQTEVTIAQISDTHIGEKRSPHAVENLKKAVEMVNARHPDAVILSGDIGESLRDRQQAKEILRSVKAPLYYVPGNHDVQLSHGANSSGADPLTHRSPRPGARRPPSGAR